MINVCICNKVIILILTRRAVYTRELVIYMEVDMSVTKPVLGLYCTSLCCKCIIL